jgi:hypothetical protein
MRVKGFALGLLMVSLVGCYIRINSIHTEFSSTSCTNPNCDYQHKTFKQVKFSVNDPESKVPANLETDIASIPKIAWPIWATLLGDRATDIANMLMEDK